jgi:hypothetical protein
MAVRREGWFAHCNDCGFGFEVIEVDGGPVPDPDDAEENICCPGCGRTIRGWSQI